MDILNANKLNRAEFTTLYTFFFFYGNMIIRVAGFIVFIIFPVLFSSF